MGLDVATLWRGATVLGLAWLAFFFGRTLRAGQASLIERIARVSEPDLPEVLQRYTRRLTGVWTAYFVLAAAFTLLGQLNSAAGVWVGLGSIGLFVGEHWLRPHLFPGHRFPGLAQQVRDTWSVWRPRHGQKS